MVRKSLLLILALAGFASADTGFPSTIKVTETDNSPSCIAGQIKFGAGQVSCSGQTATVTITGGGGGVGGTINQANQYSVGYYSGVSTTIISGLAPGTSGQVLTTGGASVSPFWSTVTSGSGMSPNATYYIQVRDTLQSGATFYVSSGTVAGKFIIKSTDTFYLLNPTANQNFSYHTTTLPSNGGVGPQIVYDFLHSRQTTDSGLVGGFYLQGSTQTYESFTSGGSGDRAALVLQAPVGTSSGSVNITLKDAVRSFSFDKNGISDIGLPSGQCVQTGTGGLLTVTGSACGSGSGGSGIVSPGTFTWTNSYGMSLSTLAVSTISFAGSGLLSATQNGLSGLLVVSTAPTGVTVGHMAVWGSSWTIVDGGVPGTGSGGSGIVSPGTFTWTNNYGLSLSTLAVSSNAYVTSGTTFYANGMMVQSISTAAYAGVYFETVTSTINVGWLKLADSYGNSGEFLKSNGAGAKPTWGVAGGGGGSSSLAVANNIVTYTGPNISSPTAILNFDTATMLATLTGSATSFVELKSSSVTLQGNTLGGDVTGTLGAMVVGDDSHSHTGATLSGIDISDDTNLAATQPIVLTGDNLGLTLISLSTGVVGTLPVGNGGTGLTAAQTATQPIVYNSATGVFGATPISLSTGIVGVLPAANFPAQVPFSVLPTTIAYITSTQTFSGYHNFVGSSTFTGSVWVSTSILLSGSIGTNGQVLTTGGPGTVPTWTTPTGGSGYATIQDEASNLTQRTTVNFTGTGVSCADDAGNTRTNCTINSGSASAGGASGNVQFNDAGTLAGASGFNIWPSSITLSTGTYKVYSSTFQIDGGSLSVNSGMVAFNNVSTMTSTAQWDQNAAFTFGGKQGQTGQFIQSSGSALAPMWGPTFTLLRTTSTLTVTGNTNVKVPQLEMTLLANSTYQIECAVVFQTTATALGVKGGVFTSAGSTGTYTIDIPVAADGTAGLFSGWISSAGDSVTGTAVQAANTNYVMHVYGNITVGTAGNFYIMAAGEGGTGSMTVREGSTCSVIGLTP